MQNQTQLELIHKHDPNTLSIVSGDRRSYYAVKRILDTVIAIALLVILSPIMLLVALLIKIYSPGPVFFIQERVGAKRHYRDGKSYWERVVFPCYKFRTMRINSDPSIHMAYIKALMENDTEKMNALQGVNTKIRKLIRDPRITRPGRLLRKFSIDELPQLINVIRGDMSLVGPRPAIPYEVEMYEHWHLLRLEALPGITGLQQVTARSTVDFEQQVRLDIEYIRNQSHWLDIKIMLKTPFVVMSAKGAE